MWQSSAPRTTTRVKLIHYSLRILKFQSSYWILYDSIFLTKMNEHIQVIMQCAAKFPELRFGQFIINVMHFELSINEDVFADISSRRLFYIPDRDLAEHCKSYCKEMGRWKPTPSTQSAQWTHHVLRGSSDIMQLKQKLGCFESNRAAIVKLITKH